MAGLELAEHQVKALKEMHNGCVLCGDVGSGKSRTAIAYYILDCGGGLKINGSGVNKKMSEPRDLFIITTAKKRDTKEWENEMLPFTYAPDVRVTVDSWNNISKYRGIYGCFFIFDEQRVIGSGVWVKSFLDVARKNRWVLLSATPGDKWTDYIPLFVANGFYKNKTDFGRRHIIYDPYISKYPKIKGYANEGTLIKYRNQILIPMKDNRHTHRNVEEVYVGYNVKEYRIIFKDRWDIYKDEPIQEAAGLCYALRRCVNSYEERLWMVLEILRKHPKAIIFYNFDYELDMLKNLFYVNDVPYAEWNGHNHDKIPYGGAWVYLVQYAAGSEGWNCITTDTIIFYSLNYSYRATIQAMGRIDRMNTPFKELYYYKLLSKSPIDQAIRRAQLNGKIFNEKAFYDKLAEKRRK